MKIRFKDLDHLSPAWRHHCGRVNDSPWPTEDRRSVCQGCGYEVRLDDFDRLLLVPVVQ